jgi:hypothetical protein
LILKLTLKPDAGIELAIFHHTIESIQWLTDLKELITEPCKNRGISFNGSELDERRRNQIFSIKCSGSPPH